MGALAVRQREGNGEPASSFGVGRYIQNFGSQNRVGALVTTRIDEAQGDAPMATNTVGVVDAFLRPTQSSYVRAAVARSATSGEGGDGTAAWVHTAASTNRGYFGWIQAVYAREYRASSGFLPRGDLILTSPAVTLDLRPAWTPRWLRSFQPGFSTAFYHRASDRDFQEGTVYTYPVGLTFQDGGSLRLWFTPEWQSLDRSFTPIRGVTIDSGSYRFTQYGATYRPDVSRKLWAWVTLQTGGYFDGRRDQAIVRVRTAPSPRAALTFDYVGNRLRGVGAARAGETTHLLYPELRMALNPRLQLVGLYQYNSVNRLSSWNARVAWEFRPLSYAYLVFNDRDFQDPALAGTAAPRERQVILKVTYLGQL
jgi:hypothetical protein